jgi:hypothetical protein
MKTSFGKEPNMLRTSRTLALTAFALLALAGAFSRPASAQMVPRLESYARNATIQAPCTSFGASLADRRTMEYSRGMWRETTVVYRGTSCAPQTALYTLQVGGAYVPGRSDPWSVAYRTVTPSAGGIGYLQQQCGQYEWSPGVAQNVATQSCGSIAFLR